MARKKKNTEDEDENVGRNWQEGELIETFHLKSLIEPSKLMIEWLDVEMPVFDTVEQANFDKALKKAIKDLKGWSEEDLKMKFISSILDLGYMTLDDKVISYFDKIISAEVEGIKLTVKSDFMLARGIMNIHKEPYFHFQEYKPNKNPHGDSMAQLLEAFLIGQTKNTRPIPLYGVDIVGKIWTFVIMDGKEYCSSKIFDSTDHEDLLRIIAILRKFRHILETRLLP